MKTTRTSLLLVTGLAILSLPRLTSAVDGMVSYWKFDEGGGNIAHDSAGGNDATLYGPTWATGIVGGALSFDGCDDYVYAGMAASSQFVDGDSFTLAAWVRTVADGTRKPVICRYRFGMEVSADEAAQIYIACLPNISWAWCESPTPLNEGEWSHLAGIYDDLGTTQNLKIYVNGEVENTLSTTALDNSYPLTPLYVGRTSHLHGLYFNGQMDDVRIYDRALAEAEVIALASLTITVEIDIKPDTDPPNPINPNSHGVIPVAILTTDSFDAADVDWTTVELAGAGVALRGKSNWLAHFEDVDGDGDDDLLVQVETDTGSAWLPGEVELTGQTWGGIPIHGSDTVILKPE